MADAVEMYSNMDLDNTIITVFKYLTEIAPQSEIRFNVTLLMKLLKIVLENNIFMFGDIYLQQIFGIAMGTCSAVMVSNIYVAYNKETKIYPKYNSGIKFYRRFIDDGIALSKFNTSTLKEFEKGFHQCRLPWTTTKLDWELVFLDLIIKLNPKIGIISTKTFEKAQNLHSYIPQNSAHALGVLKGLIYGFVR